ncbi:MAG: mercury resistance system periplasmic binding protein MerP [Pseudomonadota bacterium]
MRRIWSVSTTLALAFAPLAAVAEPRTVTLDVQGMYCTACPLTVSRALKKVPGVIEAKASYEEKSATVTYDDAKTGVDQLTKATAGAGFPSAPRSTK